MVRVPGALGVAPRCWVISLPLLAVGVVSLLVRVVDVMVLLWLLVLPGGGVDDAPGDVDAAGGDAKGEGVVGS